MTTNEEHVCGNCKWFTEEPIDHGYVCVNADSPYCAELWCRADDVCEEWKERYYIPHDLIATANSRVIPAERHYQITSRDTQQPWVAVAKAMCLDIE